jgi:hypothetical protein
VGNNLGLTTLYLYDATPSTGATGLTVRAGQNQGSEPLQKWADASGAEVARLDAAGNLAAVSLRAASNESRAGWQDGGSATDPASRVDGDLWFNTTQQVRKSATAQTRLGSCSVPANFLKPGDRVDIRFDYSHEGSASGFSIEVRWGATTILARRAVAAESVVAGKADAGIHAGGAQWSVQSWGTATILAAGAGAAPDSLAAPLTVDLPGRMAGSTTETVTLRNFTLVRYPAQANP